MKTLIGCSGFYYKHWKKKFYPEKLPQKEWLPYYAQHFNTVEINNTFYRMPEEKIFQNWMKITPPDFRFTIKANRLFTHQKKLNVDDEFREQYEAFDKAVKSLGNRLGCVLWQLPGSLHMDEFKLRALFKLFDKSAVHVIEFRHVSWFNDKIYALLSEHNVGYCMLSAPGNLPEHIQATASTAYVRFHGKDAWYNYHYSDKELKSWHSRLMQLKNVSQLYVYFNNDYHAWAIENAKMLKSIFE